MKDLFFDEQSFVFDNDTSVNYGQIEQPITEGFVTIRDFSTNDNVNGQLLIAKYERPQKTGNLFTNYLLDDMPIEERQQLVTEVMMRFDTSPRNYLKDDYFTLIRLLMYTALDPAVTLLLATKEDIDELFD